jgi:hypothetical protein
LVQSARPTRSITAAGHHSVDFETYSRSKRSDYADLADTVASILRAAIAPYPFRLQLVQARAKDPESLQKKLEERGLLATTTLEEDIKDLAGCRLIFYSNLDVTRFQQSGIFRDNFGVDWDRTKIHHPVPGHGDPIKPYWKQIGAPCYAQGCHSCLYASAYRVWYVESPGHPRRRSWRNGLGGWTSEDLFVYRPSSDPLWFKPSFLMNTNQRIQPAAVVTDGGSIPRFFWNIPGLRLGRLVPPM